MTSDAWPSPHSPAHSDKAEAAWGEVGAPEACLHVPVEPKPTNKLVFSSSTPPPPPLPHTLVLF